MSGVNPKLFDVLIEYAQGVESGQIHPAKSLAETSPALTFCESFYAQFFQNELRLRITSFDNESKKAAVALRMNLKKKRTPRAVIQLITWFEKLCDIYPNVLALGYGGGSKLSFYDFHANYLVVLLSRILAWANAGKSSALKMKVREALAAMRRAMRTISP
jgi:hypothetical protein